MGGMRIGLALLILLLVLGVGFSATTKLAGCTQIGSPGEYYLDSDISMSSNNHCIQINSDDVTIDCKSHKITGPGKDIYIGKNNFASGIYSLKTGSSYRTNLTIKNCLIESFPAGIYIVQVSTLSLRNNTIQNNNQGISTALTSFWQSSNNRIINNDYGLIGQLRGQLSDSIIKNNRQSGIRFEWAGGAQLRGAVVCSNTLDIVCNGGSISRADLTLSGDQVYCDRLIKQGDSDNCPNLVCTPCASAPSCLLSCLADNSCNSACSSTPGCTEDPDCRQLVDFKLRVSEYAQDKLTVKNSSGTRLVFQRGLISSKVYPGDTVTVEFINPLQYVSTPQGILDYIVGGIAPYDGSFSGCFDVVSIVPDLKNVYAIQQNHLVTLRINRECEVLVPLDQSKLLVITGNDDGLVNPGGRFWVSANSINVTATPNACYLFDHWTGSSGTGALSDSACGILDPTSAKTSVMSPTASNVQSCTYSPVFKPDPNCAAPSSPVGICGSVGSPWLEQQYNSSRFGYNPSSALPYKGITSWSVNVSNQVNRGLISAKGLFFANTYWEGDMDDPDKMNISILNSTNSGQKIIDIQNSINNNGILNGVTYSSVKPFIHVVYLLDNQSYVYSSDLNIIARRISDHSVLWTSPMAREYLRNQYSSTLTVTGLAYDPVNRTIVVEYRRTNDGQPVDMCGDQDSACYVLKGINAVNGAQKWIVSEKWNATASGPVSRTVFNREYSGFSLAEGFVHMVVTYKQITYSGGSDDRATASSVIVNYERINISSGVRSSPKNLFSYSPAIFTSISPRNPVIFSNDRLYMYYYDLTRGGRDGGYFLTAFDANSGNKLWDYPSQYASGKSDSISSTGVTSGEGSIAYNPVLNIFYLPGLEGLFAVNGSNGNELWNITGLRSQSNAVIDRNNNVAFTANKTIYVFDGLRGSFIWNASAHNDFGAGALVLAENSLFAGESSNYAYGSIVSAYCGRGIDLQVPAGLMIKDTIVNFTVRIVDTNVGLKGYKFLFDNGNGVFVEDQLVPITGNDYSVGVLKALPSTEAKTVRWNVIAYDLDDNPFESQTMSLVTVNTENPPVISLMSHSSDIAGSQVVFSAALADDTSLFSYTISFDNGTGTWVADNPVIVSGTSKYVSFSKTINSTIGSVIRWKISAKDIYGQETNGTDQFLTTKNTVAISVWSMYGKDLGHSHYYPDRISVSSFGLLWKVPITSSGTYSSISKYVIDSGRVYVVNGTGLVAIDLATGTRLWAAAGGLQIGPVASNGLVAYATGSRLYVLDGSTGLNKLTFSPDKYDSQDTNPIPLSLSIVSKGSESVIYLVTAERIHAITVDSIGYTISGYSSRSNPGGCTNSPITGAGNSQAIYCYPALQTSFGTVKEYLIDSSSDKFSVVNNYVLGQNRRICPSYTSGGSVPIKRSGDYLLVSVLDPVDQSLCKNAFVFNGENPVTYSCSRFSSDPVIANSNLYLACSEPDGSYLKKNNLVSAGSWSVKLDGELGSSMAVSDNLIFLATTNFSSAQNKLNAINSTNGTVEWSYSIGKRSSSPIIANGMVVVGTDDGYLYAFGTGGSMEDVALPYISNMAFNSTLAGSVVNFTATATDNVALSGYVLSIDNCTGTFVNQSFVSLAGSSASISQDLAIASQQGCRIKWKLFINDSSNAWAESETIEFTTTNVASGCGNLVCEAGLGEDSITCPMDCNRVVLSFCQQVTTAGQYFVLEQDIVDSIKGSKCIEMVPPTVNSMSADTVLDCQGHRISSANSPGWAVWAMAPSSFMVTVKDCVIDGFLGGIYAIGKANVTSNSISSYSNSGSTGIMLEGANSEISGNTAVGQNTGTGIVALARVLISGNRVSNYSMGLQLASGSGTASGSTLGNNHFCNSSIDISCYVSQLVPVSLVDSGSNTCKINNCLSPSGTKDIACSLCQPGSQLCNHDGCCDIGAGEDFLNCAGDCRINDNFDVCCATGSSCNSDGICDSPFEGLLCANDCTPLCSHSVVQTIIENLTHSSEVAGSSSSGFSANLSSSTGISSYMVSFDNCNGRFINGSWQPVDSCPDGDSRCYRGAPRNFPLSVPRTLNSTVGCTVKWKVYARDSFGKVMGSAVDSFVTVLNSTADCQLDCSVNGVCNSVCSSAPGCSADPDCSQGDNPPSVGNLRHNSTLIGSTVMLTADLGDDNGLGGYLISIRNCAGSFVNESWQGIDGKNYSLSVARSVENILGCSYGWKVFVRDSAGRVTESGTDSFVTSTENECKNEPIVNRCNVVAYSSGVAVALSNSSGSTIFDPGKYSLQGCSSPVFDNDTSTYCWMGNLIAGMHVGAFLPYGMAITKVALAISPAYGSEPGSGWGSEPITGDRFFINSGNGTSIPTVCADCTIAPGECRIINVGGIEIPADGKMHEYVLPNNTYGNYIVLRKQFNGDPALTDSYIYEFKVWATDDYGNPGGSAPVCGQSQCANEGDQYSRVYSDRYPSSCCSGLTEWDSGMDTRRVKNDQCIETGLVSGNPVGTCINCGNGICESIENVCNCPADCSGFACQDECTEGATNCSSSGNSIQRCVRVGSGQGSCATWQTVQDCESTQLCVVDFSGAHCDPEISCTLDCLQNSFCNPLCSSNSSCPSDPDCEPPICGDLRDPSVNGAGSITGGGDSAHKIISDCTDITEPGNYVLSASLTGVDGGTYGHESCINILSSNVTFDCQGNGISGTGNSGIRIYDPKGLWDTENVIVRGCDVSGFQRGIYIHAAKKDILIENNSLTNNREGIMVTMGDGIILLNNNASGNTQMGITYFADANGVIAGNNVSGNGQFGFHFPAAGAKTGGKIKVGSNTALDNPISNLDCFPVILDDRGGNIMGGIGLRGESKEACGIIANSTLKDCNCTVYLIPNGWCSNGTIVNGSIMENGCEGPPGCINNSRVVCQTSSSFSGLGYGDTNVRYINSDTFADTSKGPFGVTLSEYADGWYTGYFSYFEGKNGYGNGNGIYPLGRYDTWYFNFHPYAEAWKSDVINAELLLQIVNPGDIDEVCSINGTDYTIGRITADWRENKGSTSRGWGFPAYNYLEPFLVVPCAEQSYDEGYGYDYDYGWITMPTGTYRFKLNNGIQTPDQVIATWGGPYGFSLHPSAYMGNFASRFTEGYSTPALFIQFANGSNVTYSMPGVDRSPKPGRPNAPVAFGIYTLNPGKIGNDKAYMWLNFTPRKTTLPEKTNITLQFRLTDKSGNNVTSWSGEILYNESVINLSEHKIRYPGLGDNRTYLQLKAILRSDHQNLTPYMEGYRACFITGTYVPLNVSQCSLDCSSNGVCNSACSSTPGCSIDPDCGTTGCQQECVGGQKRCYGSKIHECSRNSSSSCYSWVDFRTCPGSQQCVMGDDDVPECGDPSCPLWSQPPPNWCSDGFRVNRGNDTNGCQLPPGCINSCAIIPSSADMSVGQDGIFTVSCYSSDLEVPCISPSLDNLQWTWDGTVVTLTGGPQPSGASASFRAVGSGTGSVSADFTKFSCSASVTVSTGGCAQDCSANLQCNSACSSTPGCTADPDCSQVQCGQDIGVDLRTSKWANAMVSAVTSSGTPISFTRGTTDSYAHVNMKTCENITFSLTEPYVATITDGPSYTVNYLYHNVTPSTASYGNCFEFLGYADSNVPQQYYTSSRTIKPKIRLLDTCDVNVAVGVATKLTVTSGSGGTVNLTGTINLRYPYNSTQLYWLDVAAVPDQDYVFVDWTGSLRISGRDYSSRCTLVSPASAMTTINGSYEGCAYTANFVSSCPLSCSADSSCNSACSSTSGCTADPDCSVTPRPLALTIGYTNTCLITADGMIKCFDTQSNNRVAETQKDSADKVVAGDGFSCYLRSSRVECELKGGNVPLIPDTDVIDIFATDSYITIKKKGGTRKCYAISSRDSVSSVTGAVASFIEGDQQCVLKDDCSKECKDVEPVRTEKKSASDNPGNRNSGQSGLSIN